MAPAQTNCRRLRAACREAVAVLLGAAPDLLVVVGGAGHTAEYPPPPGAAWVTSPSRSPWARTRSCRSR